MRSKSPSKNSVLSDTVSKGKIDLNNPYIQRQIIKRRPAGFLDRDTAILTLPTIGRKVRNTRNTDILAPIIDENLAYILKNNKLTRNWDSTKVSAITPPLIVRNLNPKVLKLFRNMRHFDGSRFTDRDIFNIVGSRIIDGTLSKLNYQDLLAIAQRKNRKDKIEIIKSDLPIVNESAALALIEKRYFPLDPSKAQSRMRWILPNWKVFATDVDKHIEIKIANGTLMPLYINDDNTFIDRISYKVQDGDFIEIKVGGVLKKLFCKSELDHAFLLPERTKQKAIALLGGTGERTLSVSSSSSGIEFDYSLSTPRQNFYVLSANLSSTHTTPTLEGSYLLKDTTVTYDLIDTSSVEQQNLRAVNNYIKYKANSRTFVIDDDDRLLDYVEDTKKVQVTQTDILFDAPKTNKTIPLLTRQVPWYIILYPTNRADYNIFNAKSKISSFEVGNKVVRTLKTKPSIIAAFSKNNAIAYPTHAWPDSADAVGVYNTQAMITQLSRDQTVFNTGYKVRSVVGSAEELAPERKKTSFRLVKEIIEELNNNYIIAWNSLGKTLTKFDVFSRLRMIEYNKFRKRENFSLLFSLIREGLIQNIKIFDPVNRASKRLTLQKTQLEKRRSTAGADTFPPIKAMSSGFTITPPQDIGGSEFSPVTRVPLPPPPTDS